MAFTSFLVKASSRLTGTRQTVEWAHILAVPGKELNE